MTDVFLAFVVVLSVITVVEFGDRTSLALIALASRQPARPTWMGAALAFVAVSAIAVALGTAFTDLARGYFRFFQIGGGLLLIGYAGYLALVPESERPPPSGRSAFRTGFVTIFLLELGDTTMILIVLFAGSLGQPFAVFAGGALGLLFVSAVACTIGARIGLKVRPRTLERFVVVILALVGVVTLVLALFPGWDPVRFG